MTHYFLGLSCKIPPLNRASVRKALALGFDKKAIVTSLHHAPLLRRHASVSFYPPFTYIALKVAAPLAAITHPLLARNGAVKKSIPNFRPMKSTRKAVRPGRPLAIQPRVHSTAVSHQVGLMQSYCPLAWGMLPKDSPETRSELFRSTLGAGQKWYDFLTLEQESFSLSGFQHP